MIIRIIQDPKSKLKWIPDNHAMLNFRNDDREFSPILRYPDTPIRDFPRSRFIVNRLLHIDSPVIITEYAFSEVDGLIIVHPP